MSTLERPAQRAAPSPSGAPTLVLVGLLSAVAGSIDAISFLSLGAAFASVMTGNVIFLGIAAVEVDAGLALSCGSAIVGYNAGVLFGSWFGRRSARDDDARHWPASAAKLFLVQLGLFVVASLWWAFGVQGDPSGRQAHVLLGSAAFAMGLQGAAIRLLKVSVSTTYMTGALTTMLEALATRRAFKTTERAATVGLPAMCAGALLAALVVRVQVELAFVLPTALLTLVLLSWWVGHRPGSAEGADAARG